MTQNSLQLKQQFDFDKKHSIHKSSFAEVFSYDKIIIKFIQFNNTNKISVQKIKCRLEKLMKVEHPNILKVESYQIGADYILIKTQKCQTNLQEFCKSNRYKQKDTKAIVLRLIGAYKHLKQLGIEIMAINLTNIFISSSGQAMLADYGLRELLQVELQKTQKVYQLPHIYEKGCETQSNIVYGFGLLYYKLLYGSVPWESGKFLSYVQNYNKNTFKFEYVGSISAFSLVLMDKILQYQYQFDLSKLTQFLQKSKLQSHFVGVHRKKPQQMPNFYELTQQIENGQLGRVYKCGKYAVKVIDLEQVSQLQKQAIKNEEKLLAKIKSQNVIRLYESFYDQNNSSKRCLVLEYCDMNLAKLLQQSPNKQLPEKQALNILQQILRGFNDLRSLNIVHGNITPQNILLQNGVVKLKDFMAGTVVEDFDNQHLQVQTTNPTHSAPEKLRCKPFTTKNQIWALGVILYTMLYGKLPYVGRTQYQLLKNMENNQLQFSQNRNISKQTIQILKCMLKSNPDQRISWHKLFHQFDIQIKVKKQKSDQKTNEANKANPFKEQNSMQITRNNNIVNRNSKTQDCIEQQDNTESQQNSCCPIACLSRIADCFNDMFEPTKRNKSVHHSQYICVEVEFSKKELTQILILQIQSSLEESVAKQITQKIEQDKINKLNKQNLEYLSNSIKYFSIQTQRAMKQLLDLKN